MLPRTFASTANQVSRNRKDPEHTSAGFEHSGHFKDYLLSLKSLLDLFQAAFQEGRIRHKCFTRPFGSQAAPSVHDLDNELKHSICF